jgi:hypothetical protein
MKKKRKAAGNPYGLDYWQCPTCHGINGEHSYDCQGKMLGVGIKNLKEREEVMLAALMDED